MDDVRATCATERLAWALLTAIGVLTLETGAFASPAISEDVPVPGGIVALSRALDIPTPDRARCLPEIARLVYGDPERARRGSPYHLLVAHLASASTAGDVGLSDLVPVPLAASVWSGAVFGRAVPSRSLFGAILSDPNAALVAYGLSALDDETLQFFADHPVLLTTLYRRHAIVFASFAAHLRIRNNRVIPPGGAAAVPLWEAVVNERVSDAVAFVTALYANAEGRTAYLYDVIGHLDRARAAFALGLWLPDHAIRVQRFRTLAQVSRSAIGEWNATDVPFARPVFDLTALFGRVQVERSGAPHFPSSQRMWTEALSGGWDDRNRQWVPSREDRPIDAAWLAQVLLVGHGEARRERLDQFAFGHRAFQPAQDAEPSELIDAISGFPHVRTLMLTLERIGVARPALYLALGRHAQQLTRLDAVQGHRALAQFQGAIAMIARMVRVQTMDQPNAERLLGTLSQVPLDAQHGYKGAIASWLEHHLWQAIASGADVSFEEALVQALAGPTGGEKVAPVSWEGQTYVFDIQASEAARLRRFRERRSVSSLDATIRIRDRATKLAAGAIGTHAIEDTLVEVRSALAKLPNTAKTIQQLTNPPPQAAEVARVLLDAVDALTGDSLLAFSYAVDWSDARGAARLDRELPRRHNFRLTALPSAARARHAWAVPRLVFRPGEPWHVEGAALGLDLALASLALRPIDDAPRSREPRMPSTNRDSFVTSLGLLNVFALRNADGNALAEAIARGESRVDALTRPGSDATAVIDEITMDGWRARALRWSVEHAPDRVPALFSMTELLRLGGAGDGEAQAWGMSALDVLGCLCSYLPPPGLQTAFSGRPQIGGLLPVTVPDLHLRVAVVLSELRLPAALAKNVLQAALYDLLIDVTPLYPDDWLAYVRRARDLSRERIEDYLAAVTASGDLLSPLPSARRLP